MGKWKAGGIPFFRDGNDISVCLFVSNDPVYGGAAPQIAKGHADKGEDPLATAIRETSEEVSIPHVLLEARPTQVISSTFRGQVSDYMFHVYAFEVEGALTLTPTEEGCGVWLNFYDAVDQMREDQVRFLLPLISQIQKAA